jgi:LuxR family transcriptional regulator, maltose regulon positive regulatory protein
MYGAVRWRMSSPSDRARRDARRPSADAFAAKLAPLVQRAAEVRRVGVAERLQRAGGVKVVLVRAPAGFGKTTAMLQVREAMEEKGVATAWLTLDRSDNDVPRFLAGLAAAVAQTGFERRLEVSSGIAELLAAVPGPFALFLDDFEVVREGGVVGLVREIIDNLPRDGQLVIGSRSLPDLGLGRLRARGQLLELDTDVLRFSTAEAAELFLLRGAELSLHALDQAHSKTEGWVAALWLLSLALQRHGAGSDFVARLSESERDVADYLTEEVLAQQEPVVRTFLLRTSVLRHLSAPVCQALLPGVDCAAILRDLERSNIFLTPLTESRDLFRYHSLFADFLRAQLIKEQPEQLTRLHLAAAGWYESEGRPVPAIDHAIEGGDHPYALNLLQQQAESLLEQGRMRLLDRWFSAVPAQLLQGRGLLQVIAVWARAFTQGPWNAMDWLESSGCLDSTDAAVQAHVRALLPVVLGMMDRDDEAREAGLAGVARLPSGHAFADSVLLNAMAYIISVNGERREAHRFLENARSAQGESAFNRMYTETVGGVLDLREGRLRQATARFRMALTSASHAGPYNPAHGNAWAGVFYVGVVYEANDLIGAERLLNVYLPLARDVGLPDHMISSHRLRSRIAFEHGDVDTAFQALTELEYLGHQRQLPRVVANAKLERSRLLVLQGNGPAAREELARADDPVVWAAVARRQHSAQDVEDLFIGRLRVELRFGDPKPEVARIQTELRQALAAERRHRALKLQLFLAIALYRTGDLGRALDEVIVVLREASREGFVRIVLDEGPDIGPILKRVVAATQEGAGAGDPIFAEYLQRLLALYGPTGLADDDDATPSSGANALAEPLTRKEIRVLQLLAEGYSNTAMAEKLFVSDSTVRTHLRNINAKLDSRSRTQAVAIARRLGVIR